MSTRYAYETNSRNSPRTLGQYTGYPDHPLATARAKAGLTVDELTQKAGLTGRWRVTEHCSGRQRLRPDELARVAEVLGVTVGEIETGQPAKVGQ